ncbi:MAG: BamA/TamA family outer membrane protein [Acidobacteriota bacterium]
MFRFTRVQCLRVVVLAVLSVGNIPSAFAQDELSNSPQTRLEQIEKERRAKAANPQPAHPNRLKRILDATENVILASFENPPAGLQPKLSSSARGWDGFVPGSGFSLGVQYYRPDLAKGEIASRSAAVGTLEQNYLFDTQLTLPRLAGNRLVLDFLGRYKAERSIDYYGPGPNSLKGARTNYSRERSETSLRLGWKPNPRHLELGVVGGLLWFNVGPGIAKGIASSEEAFTAGRTPGIQEQTDFLRVGSYLQFHSNDNPNIMYQGTRVRAGFDYYRDRHFRSYSFRLLHGSIEHYVPFLNHKRVLALRARTAISYANANQSVPFYLQQTLGGPNDLRGFRNFRFTDYNSLVLNAEYRWEVAPPLDMALFADGGKVFRDPGQLNFRDLESSVGFGFRIKGRSSVITRIDFGFSREGFRLWFRFSDLYR